MRARTKRPSQRDEPSTSSLVDRRRECDGGHVRRGVQSHRFGVVPANGGVVIDTLVRTWMRSWRQRSGEHARAERRQVTRNTKSDGGLAGLPEKISYAGFSSFSELIGEFLSHFPSVEFVDDKEVLPSAPALPSLPTSNLPTRDVFH